MPVCTGSCTSSGSTRACMPPSFTSFTTLLSPSPSPDPFPCTPRTALESRYKVVLEYKYVVHSPQIHAYTHRRPPYARPNNLLTSLNNLLTYIRHKYTHRGHHALVHPRVPDFVHDALPCPLQEKRTREREREREVCQLIRYVSSHTLKARFKCDKHNT